MVDGDVKLMIDNFEKLNELCLESQMEDFDDVVFKFSCLICDFESKKYVYLYKNG